MQLEVCHGLLELIHVEPLLGPAEQIPAIHRVWSMYRDCRMSVSDYDFIRTSFRMHYKWKLSSCRVKGPLYTFVPTELVRVRGRGRIRADANYRVEAI